MEENKIKVDGVEYIRYDRALQLKSQKIRDIIILVLIAGAVIALVMAIFTLVTNKDIINKDALIIGMERHDFVSCQCTDKDNTEWYSNSYGFETLPAPSISFLDLTQEDLEVPE